MSQITWRNINAPDFGQANALTNASADRISAGIAGLQQLAQDMNAVQQQNYDAGVKYNTGQLVDQLVRAGSMEDLRAVDTQQFGAQINPEMVNQAFYNQSNVLQQRAAEEEQRRIQQYQFDQSHNLAVDRLNEDIRLNTANIDLAKNQFDYRKLFDADNMSYQYAALKQADEHAKLNAGLDQQRIDLTKIGQDADIKYRNLVFEHQQAQDEIAQNNWTEEFKNTVAGQKAQQKLSERTLALDEAKFNMGVLNVNAHGQVIRTLPDGTTEVLDATKDANLYERFTNNKGHVKAFDKTTGDVIVLDATNKPQQSAFAKQASKLGITAQQYAFANELLDTYSKIPDQVAAKNAVTSALQSMKLSHSAINGLIKDFDPVWQNRNTLTGEYKLNVTQQEQYNATGRANLEKALYTEVEHTNKWLGTTVDVFNMMQHPENSRISLDDALKRLNDENGYLDDPWGWGSLTFKEVSAQFHNMFPGKELTGDLLIHIMARYGSGDTNIAASSIGSTVKNVMKELQSTITDPKNIKAYNAVRAEVDKALTQYDAEAARAVSAVTNANRLAQNEKTDPTVGPSPVDASVFLGNFLKAPDKLIAPPSPNTKVTGTRSVHDIPWRP